MKLFQLILATTLLPLSAYADSFPRPILPTHEEAREVCGALASGVLSQAQDKFLTSGLIDINNNGQPETVTKYCHGTANICIPALGDGSQDREWFVFDSNHYGSSYGIFAYNRHVYTAHYEGDQKFPHVLTYISSDNVQHVVCKFETTAYAALLPVAKEGLAEEICARASYGGVYYLPKEPYTGQKPNAPLNRVVADIDGDGSTEILYELHTLLPHGRSCENNSFVIGDSAEKYLSQTPAARLLDKMQDGLNSSETGYIGGACEGNSINWFALNQEDAKEGPIYLEFRGNPNTQSYRYDWWVRTIQAGQVVDVCKGDVRREIRVGAYGKEFQQPEKP